MAGVPKAVWLKIERANHHIKDLEVKISEFMGSGPYKTVGNLDADGRATYRLANVQPIPPIILLITGDAIQNLRASLDYLACALWSRTNSGECKRVQFPFLSAADHQAKGLGQIKGMGQDAEHAISAVEPYEGGKGDLLWKLHRLSIIDKHRLPITIVGGNLGVHMPTFYPELFSESERSNPWNLLVSDLTFSLKNNDILFRDEPGRELKQDVKFPFFIALDETGVFERKSLLPALNRFSDCVSKTVSSFDPLFP